MLLSLVNELILPYSPSTEVFGISIDAPFSILSASLDIEADLTARLLSRAILTASSALIFLKSWASDRYGKANENIIRAGIITPADFFLFLKSLKFPDMKKI